MTCNPTFANERGALRDWSPCTLRSPARWRFSTNLSGKPTPAILTPQFESFLWRHAVEEFFPTKVTEELCSLSTSVNGDARMTDF